MKAYVRAYDPGVAHRNYDPSRGRVIDGFQHWDWRYKIVAGNGQTLYRRQGFCSWERAAASLARSWPRILRAVQDDGQGAP